MKRTMNPLVVLPFVVSATFLLLAFGTIEARGQNLTCPTCNIPRPPPPDTTGRGPAPAPSLRVTAYPVPLAYVGRAEPIRFRRLRISAIGTMLSITAVSSSGQTTEMTAWYVAEIGSPPPLEIVASGDGLLSLRGPGAHRVRDVTIGVRSGSAPWSPGVFGPWDHVHTRYHEHEECYLYGDGTLWCREGPG